MASEEQVKREVPEVEEAFSELLKKFRIGVKDNMAETITENIARTGGERVYEAPQRLAERLATWNEYITPVKRKQILEQWFAEKGVEVPPEALQLAGASAKQIKEQEEAQQKEEREEKKREAKFFVEEESGRIRAAKEGETALTWAEAEKVANRINKERKSEKGEERESPFIINEEGKWTINPKAKLSFTDAMVWDMFRKAEERGEETDPFEVMRQRAQEVEMFRSAFGGGREGTSMSDVADTMLKLKELSGADEEIKNMLAGIYKHLEEGGGGKRGSDFSDFADAMVKMKELMSADEDMKNILAGIYRSLEGGAAGKGGSEEVKELREKIDSLSESLHKKEQESLIAELTAVKGQIATLRQELDKKDRERTAKSEYDIMSQGLAVIDRRLGSMEQTIGGFFRNPPAPLSKEEKKTITQGISEEVEAEEEVERLGKKAWYGA